MRVLIIEDEDSIAEPLAAGLTREGHDVTRAATGGAGLAAAGPDVEVVLLDLRLPDMDGWVVLDRLKHDPATRHIPVHIISGEEQRQRALNFGAVTHLQKPVSREDLASAFDRIAAFAERRVRRLLVVEDDDAQRRSIEELVGHDDVEITAVASAEEALRALRGARGTPSDRMAPAGDSVSTPAGV